MTQATHIEPLTTSLHDPSTGVPIGEWSEATPDQLDTAVGSALRGFDAVSGLTRWQRCDLLVKTGNRLAARRDDVVTDLMLEHGKVKREAEAEVETAIHSFLMNAEYARRLDGSIPEVSDRRKRVLVTRIPLGVVGVITPWNFPVNIPVEYLAPALAMGNSVLWKGAETTQRSSRHLYECFSEAGWPEGSISYVEGGPGTGASLAQREELSAICFTGSSVVGHEIASIGGKRRLLLELGGNGPSIVLADADLERAASAIINAVTLCSGQSCAATERVMVDRTAYSEFLEAVIARSEDQQVGAPDAAESAFGPLHLAQTASTLRNHVADATSRGARLIRGGAHESDRPTDRFWPLTLLADVDPGSLVMTEESFGPILPISPFDSHKDLANRVSTSDYGLSGAVFTRDLDRAFNVAEQLACGTVTINDRSDTWETHVPFGGFPGTSSGIGRVGGEYAMQELSTVRTIVFDIEPDDA